MKSKLLPWGLGLTLVTALSACSLTEPVDHPVQNPVSAANPAATGPHLAVGYAYLDAGQYRLALLEFDLALRDIGEQGDASQQAEIYSASGYALYLLHLLEPEQADTAEEKRIDFAEPRLTLALKWAKQANNPALEARIRAYRGLVYARLSQDMAFDAIDAGNDGRQDDNKRDLDLVKNYRQQALAEFQQSQALAVANKDLALRYAVELHLARLEKNPSKRLKQLQQVDSHLPAVTDVTSRVNLLLNIMDQLDAIRNDSQSKGLSAEVLPFGFELAGRTIALADQAGMRRAQSQGEGFLAMCYEQTGKLGDAVQHTELAIRHSVEAKASDLTMAWQSQLGRLMALEGREDDAMMAYRRAMFYVDEIRNDIPLVNADGKSSYSDTLEPIYRGMANLLLRAASRKPRQEDRQALLFEAIYSLENLKESELEDYFNARCSLVASDDEANTPPQSPVETLSPLSALGGLGHLDKTLHKLSGNTAILYPIVFKDRLELLLAYQQGNGKGGLIVQKTINNASKEKLDATAKELNDQLNYGAGKGDRWKPSSLRLYQWLIQPVQTELQSAGINRIIYIPDGMLRLAPISAFYDGRSFVAEHYAIVINNGLQYTASTREPGALGKTLLAGLSKPDGPSVDQLPVNFQDAAVDWAVGNPTRGTKKPKPTVQRPKRGTPEYRQKLVEGMTLPSVDEEIHSLQGMLGTQGTLLNENFTHGNLEKDLQTGDYEFIHIASHGHFGHTAKESFIMTYDKTLHVDEVEKVIQGNPGQGRPLDLVTFSACETASGDDRAPLGFSGIAIKAKVRNALGALWPIDDKATSQFMEKFYQALNENGGDKASALQQAQNRMIQEGYTQPFFWAAFILVGSW